MLANGRLTSVGDQAEVASVDGAAPEPAAIAAALRQPFTDVALSGALIPDHLANNALALNPRTEHSNPEGLAMDPNTYWTQRAERPWT